MHVSADLPDVFTCQCIILTGIVDFLKKCGILIVEGYKEYLKDVVR